MAEACAVGIGRVTLSRRERLVIVEPRDAGMVAITLRASEEVRAAAFAKAHGEIDGDMVAIAGTIIKRRSGHFGAATFRNRYQEALSELIGEDGRPIGQAERHRNAGAGALSDERAQAQPGAGNRRGREA
jgi:DNA end-binding protein Ku